MVEVKGELQPTPKPIPGAFDQLSRFHGAIKPFLTKTTRLTPKQFLGFYSGRKLERYTRAVESLEVLPVTEKDAWLSTFVKAEKLNISAKPDPAPRVIQPRDPRYNVELGRYLRHSEEYLFEGINKLFGGRTIFKGLSADQAGLEMESMWNSFDNPIGIGMDASRFDQHISVDALQFEHKMWLEMFPHSERAELRRLLSWQLHNRGLARCPDGEIRYKVDGCRMSGDMNTSSGNCYIMCATVWNWCVKNGIKKFRLANNGDDCMVVIEAEAEGRFRKGLIDYYTELGFTMKVEDTVSVLEREEFCQTRPLKINGTYRMIRNLHQSLSKDLHCLNDIARPVDAAAWVHAVGVGGRCLNDGVPVMKEFFKRFPINKAPKVGSDLSSKLEDDWRFKFNRTETFTDSTPDDESRYSFWLAFGILPDEQEALELQFPQLPMGNIDADIVEEASLLSFSKA